MRALNSGGYEWAVSVVVSAQGSFTAETKSSSARSISIARTMAASGQVNPHERLVRLGFVPSASGDLYGFSGMKG